MVMQKGFEFGFGRLYAGRIPLDEREVGVVGGWGAAPLCQGRLAGGGRGCWQVGRWWRGGSAGGRANGAASANPAGVVVACVLKVGAFEVVPFSAGGAGDRGISSGRGTSSSNSLPAGEAPDASTVWGARRRPGRCRQRHRRRLLGRAGGWTRLGRGELSAGRTSPRTPGVVASRGQSRATAVHPLVTAAAEERPPPHAGSTNSTREAGTRVRFDARPYQEDHEELPRQMIATSRGALEGSHLLAGGSPR